MEATNLAEEHFHVCPKNANVIQDAEEAEEEEQYRKQMEGTRQVTMAKNVRHQENLNTKNLPVTKNIAREQSKQMADERQIAIHHVQQTWHQGPDCHNQRQQTKHQT